MGLARGLPSGLCDLCGAALPYPLQLLHRAHDHSPSPQGALHKKPGLRVKLISLEY
jgi:hypothetical protein